ncbi:MAG: peroxiredoxin family protein [Acidobacteriota bacterium]
MRGGAPTRRAAAGGLALALAAAVPAPPAEAAAARDPGFRRAFEARFVGKPAPPFAARGLDGRTLRLEDYRGRVVLLNFWFSSCPPCRTETPTLMALYEFYREKGLTVLGVNLDDILIPRFDGSLRKRFLETFDVNYPILIADRELYRAYGEIPVQPMSFLIDRDGTVARIFFGAVPDYALDEAIRPRLARPSPSRPRSSSRPPPG